MEKKFIHCPTCNTLRDKAWCLNELLKILEENDGLCMDDENDRVALAAVLAQKVYEFYHVEK